MLRMKISTTKEGTILALCDSELLGKVYREKEIILDLQKYASFYDGSDVDEKNAKMKEQLIIATKYAKSINVVGERSIKYIKELGFNVKNIRTIANIPHLQIYRI